MENERIYKSLKRAGVANLVLGIIVLVTGLVTGILMVVNGGRLLSNKKHILL